MNCICELHSLHCTYLSLWREEMSQNPGDELNLRHFHCSRRQQACYHVQELHLCNSTVFGTVWAIKPVFAHNGHITLSKNCTCVTRQFSALYGP